MQCTDYKILFAVVGKDNWMLYVNSISQYVQSSAKISECCMQIIKYILYLSAKTIECCMQITNCSQDAVYSLYFCKSSVKISETEIKEIFNDKFALEVGLFRSL